jgi:homoserine kinase
MAASWSVRVPASTSNLGPGFDLLGAALSLALEVRLVGEAPTHRFARLDGEAADWPEEDNLVFSAFDLARGGAAGGFVFEARSEIPVARGLGSSGAAIAAGLLLGTAVSGREVTRAQLLRLGLPLEGHPDNLAPALLGGCRLTVPREAAAPHVLLQEVHPSIGWAVAWPEVQVPTSAARAALPRDVPFAAAAENPRRLALLLAGLRSGDPDLLRDGIVDCLHAEHRLALVPGSRGVLKAALAAGAWAATVSGSGSAHVALAPRPRAAEVARAMEGAWREATGAGTGREVELVQAAPEVVRG